MARKKPIKQYDSRPTCGGKNCYVHKHEAEAIKEENELLQPGLALDIYRCHLCASWHLTRRTVDTRHADEHLLRDEL